MLLYSILQNDRLSQRSLEDTSNDSIFKSLFALDESKKVRCSFISDRFSKIDSDYFKTTYENIYTQFFSVYSKKESKGYNIIRVDSTIVSETAGKLAEELDCKTSKNIVNIVLYLMVYYLVKLRLLMLLGIVQMTYSYLKLF